MGLSVDQIAHLRSLADGGDIVAEGLVFLYETVARGLKKPVKCASTAVNPSSPGATVDGLTMALGDRFAKNTSPAAANNGIWVWQGPSKPASRPDDFDTADKVRDCTMFPVQRGTYENMYMMVSTNDPFVIGTTAILLVDTLSLAVPLTRILTTTAPLQIAGAASANLSADRTLSILNSVATNVGAGDAGKLFKLDGAGKAAGRVLEVDGAKLDLILAAGAATVTKNNFAAAIAPVVTDDYSSLGYSVGSKWYDTTADRMYVCLDSSTGAAVWQLMARGAVATANATATNVAEARTGFVRYTNPIAKSANAGGATLVVNVLAADGVQILAAQPDYPRKLALFITDGDSSISAGIITIVGIDASGNNISEAIALTGGTAKKISTLAYATITSATISALAGGGAGDNIALGVDSALGLPGNKTPAASAYAVHKAMCANADEAVGTVDAAAGTINPTTAPNGARYYDFFYTFAVTVVQSAHAHTQS